MKKTKGLLWAGIALVSVGLAACNNQGTNDSGKAETSEKAQKKLSKEEVIDKVNEASKDIKSAEMTTDMKMDMTMNGQEMNTETNMVVTYTMEPFAMKMDSKVNAAGQEQQAVMYMDDKAMYMQTPGSEEWMTQDLSSLGMDIDSLMEMYSSQEMMDTLGSYKDKLDVKEEKDHYVLSFEGSGEELKDLAKAALAESNTGNTGAGATEAEEALDDMKIGNMSYEMTVSKTDFYPMAFNMTMDYEMNQEGMEMKASMDQKAMYDKINAVEPIEIPEAAK
uniref:DUF6612 family protein n=1 Tax=Candidatus Enterococcus willemsii TaxID=1857215 RepID=UPI00403FBDA3